MGSKVIEDAQDAHNGAVHHAEKTVPTVPVESMPTLNIGAQGCPLPESYPKDPVDLARLLEADGTYHTRAVASILKRRA